MLHLDVMTVTGKTLGENLDELKRNGFYDKCDAYCAQWGTTWQDIIHPFDKAIGTDGAIAILKGNLAPEGAVIKHTACPKEMFQATLKARPFDCEEDAIYAVLQQADSSRRGCVHPLRRPQGLRHAGDVLHLRSHLL